VPRLNLKKRYDNCRYGNGTYNISIRSPLHNVPFYSDVAVWIQGIISLCRENKEGPSPSMTGSKFWSINKWKWHKCIRFEHQVEPIKVWSWLIQRQEQISVSEWYLDCSRDWNWSDAELTTDVIYLCQWHVGPHAINIVAFSNSVAYNIVNLDLEWQV